MNLKRIKLVLLLASAFLINGCGMHYDVKGQVVDAITKQPVEGAVVAVDWIRYKISPPGLPTDKESYGTTESITDKRGYFSVPKYPFGTHYMGVYKKGYVCWGSETIFNPAAKTHEEMYRDRPRHRVASGMLIYLQPVKHDEFTFKHASFADVVNSRLGRPLHFNKASYKLRKIYWDQ